MPRYKLFIIIIIIKTTLTDKPLIAPALCFISPRIMHQFQAMVATNQYSVEPILVHSHEYVYTTHRRAATRQPEGSEDAGPQPATALSYALAMSMVPPSY